VERNAEESEKSECCRAVLPALKGAKEGFARGSCDTELGISRLRPPESCRYPPFLPSSPWPHSSRASAGDEKPAGEGNDSIRTSNARGVCVLPDMRAKGNERRASRQI
jgi:hypothetical protein